VPSIAKIRAINGCSASRDRRRRACHATPTTVEKSSVERAVMLCEMHMHGETALERRGWSGATEEALRETQRRRCRARGGSIGVPTAPLAQRRERLGVDGHNNFHDKSLLGQFL
jgi:hypothetical protein